MGLNPGDLIDDKYRIVRLIGEGGMGAVYEGENTRIHRRVAIKVLHANVAGMTDVVARFEREAQAAGRIGSEHIVEVLDLGTLSSGDRYMVMEFMDGDSLSDRIRQRGRLHPQELYPIARQLLDALSAAHNAGIVHRDLKPDNVFLLRNRRSQPDFVKLLDFGISKFGGTSTGLSMTRTGAVMGTPYYMAPEQAKGSREVDHRVDLYAVGVILYEALAGQVPFLADTFNELLFKIVLEKPLPLNTLAPELDPYFVHLVEKAMAREPAERFQSAQEIQLALDEWARGAGVSANASGGYPAIEQRTGHGLNPLTPIENAPLGATPGTWSGTSTSAEPTFGRPKPSRASLVATFAAIVVIAGGSGTYMLLSGKSPADAASGTATSGVSDHPVAALPSALPAAASEPTKPSSEPATPTIDLAPAASAHSETPPVTAKATPTKAVAPKTSKVATAKATTTSVKAAPAQPAPAPIRNEGTTPSGRKIRQTL
jgi:serine/threonine-protein kinase